MTNSLEGFFEGAVDLSQRVYRKYPDALEIHLAIGGHLVQLKFASPGLDNRILPAVRHLIPSIEGQPDLTVYLWDYKSTGTLLPPPPWEELEFFERGNVRGYRDGRFTLVFDRRTDVFSGVDIQKKVAIYWTRQADTLPFYEVGAPMRHLLQGWLQHKGLFITHSAAVGRPDGGVLLAGRTGSGKSTTALVSLRSNLRYASDDYALTTMNPHPYIYNLYNTAKMNVSSLDWVPEFRPQVSNPERLDVEKAMIFLSPEMEDKLISGFPLKAILLPQATDGSQTQVLPVDPKTAFMAIVPDTVFTALGDARLVFQTYRKLVYQVPSYRMLLGSDLEQIPEAINQILEDPTGISG